MINCHLHYSSTALQPIPCQLQTVFPLIVNCFKQFVFQFVILQWMCFENAFISFKTVGYCVMLVKCWILLQKGFQQYACYLHRLFVYLQYFSRYGWHSITSLLIYQVEFHVFGKKLAGLLSRKNKYSLNVVMLDSLLGNDLFWEIRFLIADFLIAANSWQSPLLCSSVSWIL